MIKVGVLGHFGGEEPFFDGQTIKTKLLAEELNKIQNIRISRIDTYKIKGNFFSFLASLIKQLIKVDHLIVLPAKNGVKYLLPFIVFINVFFRKKIHYVVIGGWISELVIQKKYLRWVLKRVSSIQVETERVIISLQKMGMTNIHYLPNFKEIDTIQKEEISKPKQSPFRLCTLSRVIPEKGIEDAMQVVEDLNKKYNKDIFRLDIYGQIFQGYEEHFYKLLENSSTSIQYKGILKQNEITKTLKSYHFLLFPTKYKTEGIPGTIIDAFSSGVPVICSKWQSANQVVQNKVTGYIYEFDDINNFSSILEECYLNSENMLEMKYNCLLESRKYISKDVIKSFYNNFIAY